MLQWVYNFKLNAVIYNVQWVFTDISSQNHIVIQNWNISITPQSSCAPLEPTPCTPTGGDHWPLPFSEDEVRSVRFSLPGPAQLVLLGAPSFCIKVFFKFFCTVAYVKSLFFFYSWIGFHCVNTSHFVYPLTCHWIFVVFLTLWFKLLSACRYKYSCVYFYFSWMGTKKCNGRVMT